MKSRYGGMRDINPNRRDISSRQRLSEFNGFANKPEPAEPAPDKQPKMGHVRSRYKGRRAREAAMRASIAPPLLAAE